MAELGWTLLSSLPAEAPLLVPHVLSTEPRLLYWLLELLTHGLWSTHLCIFPLLSVSTLSFVPLVCLLAPLMYQIYFTFVPFLMSIQYFGLESPSTPLPCFNSLNPESVFISHVFHGALPVAPIPFYLEFLLLVCYSSVLRSFLCDHLISLTGLWFMLLLLAKKKKNTWIKIMHRIFSTFFFYERMKGWGESKTSM